MEATDDPPVEKRQSRECKANWQFAFWSPGGQIGNLPYIIIIIDRGAARGMQN